MKTFYMEQIVSREYIINNQKMANRKKYLYSIPTQEDIDDLQNILDDFKIKNKIPKFNTVEELENWRRFQIKMKLR